MCDIILLTAAVTLIVGMFVRPIAVTIAGFALFMIGSALSVVRTVLVVRSDVFRASPEFRNAVVNLVIMSVVFALATFGLIYNIVTMV